MSTEQLATNNVTCGTSLFCFYVEHKQCVMCYVLCLPLMLFSQRLLVYISLSTCVASAYKVQSVLYFVYNKCHQSQKLTIGHRQRAIWWHTNVHNLQKKQATFFCTDILFFIFYFLGMSIKHTKLCDNPRGENVA